MGRVGGGGGSKLITGQKERRNHTVLLCTVIKLAFLLTFYVLGSSLTVCLSVCLSVSFSFASWLHLLVVIVVFFYAQPQSSPK